METVDYRQILATETDANRGVVTELGRAVLNANSLPPLVNTPRVC